MLKQHLIKESRTVTENIISESTCLKRETTTAKIPSLKFRAPHQPTDRSWSSVHPSIWLIVHHSLHVFPQSASPCACQHWSSLLTLSKPSHRLLSISSPQVFGSYQCINIPLAFLASLYPIFLRSSRHHGMLKNFSKTVHLGPTITED